MNCYTIKQAVKGLLFACVLSSFWPIALAQQATVHKSTRQGTYKGYVNSTDSIAQENTLDNVVCTGSRTMRLMKNEPIPIRLIKAKEIEILAPQNFMDLLQYVLPGVEFTKHGSQDRLKMQGFDASSLLFLIDGERISSGMGSDIDFNRINPDDIERIEVLRGASSALYGSNAIGGVINIITRQAKVPLRVGISSMIDNRLDLKETLSIGVKKKFLTSQTSVQYIKDNGYVMQENGSNREINVSGNRIWDISEKLTIAPSQKLQFTLSGRASLRRQLWDPKINYLYHSYDGIAGMRWQFDEKQGIDLSYHYNNYARDSIFPEAPEEANAPVFRQQMHHARAQYNYDFDDIQHLNLGGEYTFDQVASSRLHTTNDGKPKHIQSGVIYAQGILSVFDKVTLSYGGRLDLHSGFGTHYTSRASAMYNPSQQVALRLTYAQGYRAPSMQELYMYFDHMGMFMIHGNEELKPEQSHMISLSMEYKAQETSLMVNTFFNSVNNRIQPLARVTKEEKSELVYSNIDGTSRIYGIEFQGQQALPWGLRIRGSYSYTYDWHQVKDKEGNTGLRTSTRPHSLLLSLDYNKYFSNDYSIGAFFTLRWMSGFTSSEYNSKDLLSPITTPGYATTRIGIEQKILRHLRLNLGIDNLFDYRPKVINTNVLPTPGRTYSATLRFQF